MRRNKGFGFTLVEILVALAIVAIIAAVAFPSYFQVTLEGRRQDGIAALYNANNEVTEYLLNNNGAIPTTAAMSATLTTTSPKNFYTVAYCVDNAANPTRYFLVASADTNLNPTETAAGSCTSRGAFTSVQANDTACVEMVLDNRFSFIFPNECK